MFTSNNGNTLKLSYFLRYNISECVIFYSLCTSGFKTEASFNEKISFMRSAEKRRLKF